MENHTGPDIGTMFKVSKQKSRTPPDEMAFFFILNFWIVGIILLNGSQPGDAAYSVVFIQSLTFS